MLRTGRIARNLLSGEIMSKSGKDVIYSQPHDKIENFTFDQAVAEVFPDMIQRSVPGYSTIIDNIGLLAKQYAQNNSNIYDLGCSLGAATLSMQRYVEADNCQIIAVDNSEAMVSRCKNHINTFKSLLPVQVICDDIQNSEIENASVVVLNFTLQFISPENRIGLLKKLYNGMLEGGILILSEKMRHPTEQGNGLLVDLHHEFKRRNGYSELEISQKRTALEKVMLTDTLATHNSRLKSAGFKDVVPWFSCFNFSSLVAIK